jgi:hypothetical protein
MPIRTKTNRPMTTLTLAGAAILLAVSSSGAQAQNALGDGTALDANPGQYGTTNSYTRPSLVDELRFRNAIATGNAPGGLSFRGDIGYRAQGEFTADLGSDELFAFRRDSLYSGLAGMGIRGTDALQYQFALTTGAAPPRNLMGSLSYTRDDQYAASTNYQNTGGIQQPGTLGIDREQRRMDPTGQALSTDPSITGLDSGSMMGTLRSSSTYSTTNTMQPSLISVYREGIDRRPVGLIASPLLGVTPAPLVDSTEKPANPLVARPPNADTDPSVPGGLPSTRVTTSYDELVSQMRERVQELRDESMVNGTSTTIKPEESNDAWLVRQMDEIRRQLYGDQATQPQTDSDAAEDPNAADPMSPASDAEESEEGTQSSTNPLISVPDNSETPLGKRLTEGQERLEELNREFELNNPTQVSIDRETMEILRGNAADEVQELLVPGESEDSLYTKHIATGQRLIASGRYFDAEERFTHALSLRPRDIVAQQGRLHAQIGAGMLLSASVNLQTLYSENPELITRRFSGKLLPDAERIEALKKRLGERAGIIEIEIRTRPLEGDRVRVSAALLYAYIGYQSGDQGVVDEGLSVVSELGTDSDRRFADLLKQLWVIPDAQGTP